MTQQMTVRKTVFHTARQRTLAVLAAVIAAIALPQLFHMLGAVTGMGTALGQIFLPMHLPVLLVGLLAGPAAGLAAGAVSPLLSYAISGMPVLTGLPFMALELAVYGLIAVCSRIGTCRSLPSCSSHSLPGRAVKAAGLGIAVYALGNTSVPVSSVWTGLVTGLPGLLLQWSLLPLLMFRISHWEQNHV